MSKHTPAPLPVLEVQKYWTLSSGKRVSCLAFPDNFSEAVTCGIGPDSSVTADMIADRFNAYPALVEALKAVRANYAGPNDKLLSFMGDIYADGYREATLEAAKIASEALAKAGVK